MPAVAPAPPFWHSPWSRGVRGGKTYQSCTVAASRAERKKRKAVVTIWDEVVARMTPEERKDFVAARFQAALKELGLTKVIADAARVAMLHGWDPKAKPIPKLVAATH